MHIISRKPFADAAKAYPNQRQALEDTYKVLKRAKFSSPGEMKAAFPSLDNFKYKDRWWIIDIGGNHLRMIAFIQFVQNRLYVKHIVSHADYNKICKRYARGTLR